MAQQTTCYMCSNPSTSKEHVPPRCLFPEAKDVGGDNRKNLITVPSCDKHNSQKSSDDEFLMVSLAGIIGNNSIGFRHKSTKVNRAIYRSSFALLKQAMKNQQWHVVEIAPNKFLDVIWGTPDHARLRECFDRIARALHFNTFNLRFFGSTKSVLAYIPSQESNGAEFQRFIRDKMQLELAGKPRFGDNPEVFSFAFSDTDQLGLKSLHMQFYGGLNVYMAMIPANCKLPQNLGMELIDRGIRTTITLGEKEYVFNTGESESDSSPLLAKTNSQSRLRER